MNRPGFRHVHVFKFKSVGVMNDNHTMNAEDRMYFVEDDEELEEELELTKSSTKM